MKVFIFADMEGATGICRFTQTSDKPNSQGLPPHEKMVNYSSYREACHLLMGDVNACVEGLLDAGVDDILVRDGHGIPYNFIPDLMHPRARYIVGDWGSLPLGGLEHDCDAIILLCHHAMAGTPDGVLCHTQSPSRGDRYWYNGRETGEIGQEALIAGHFDIPVIMVSGDEAACRETRAFFGEDVVTVAVKKGLAREGAILLPPGVTAGLIRAGTHEALSRIGRCKPYKIDLPIRARLWMADVEKANAFRREGAGRVDEHTFEMEIDRAVDLFRLC